MHVTIPQSRYRDIQWLFSDIQWYLKISLSGYSLIDNRTIRYSRIFNISAVSLIHGIKSISILQDSMKSRCIHALHIPWIPEMREKITENTRSSRSPGSLITRLILTLAGRVLASICMPGFGNLLRQKLLALMPPSCAGLLWRWY